MAKKQEEKRPEGRPPLFSDPKELQKKIDEYFEDGAYIDKRTINGIEVEKTVYTISDLVLYCGFSNRKSFYAYEEKPEFSHTIKRARQRIESIYERALQTSPSPTGSIFALKNFGWSDKQEVEHSGDVTTTVKYEIPVKRSIG